MNGRRALRTLYDASADVVLTNRMSLGGYYGHVAGGAASATSYPTSNHAAFGYVELLVRL